MAKTLSHPCPPLEGFDAPITDKQLFARELRYPPKYVMIRLCESDGKSVKP